MRKLQIGGIALLVLISLVGCSSGDDVSPQKAQEMKEGFSKGVDESKITPEQRDHMKQFMGGGAAGAASAPATGTK